LSRIAQSAFAPGMRRDGSQDRGILGMVEEAGTILREWKVLFTVGFDKPRKAKMICFGSANALDQGFSEAIVLAGWGQTVFVKEATKRDDELARARSNAGKGSGVAFGVFACLIQKEPFLAFGNIEA